jgi:hypothetical protein
MKMKQKQSPIDNELKILCRRWPHLPDYVRRALLDLVSKYGPAAISIRFPTPANAKWTDVEIILTSSHDAKMTVGDVTQYYSFTELGLADKRSPKRPRIEWQMLRTYAENPQADAYYRLPFRKNLKVDISKFRKWLQAFFGIPGDPLTPFATGKWMPRFKVREG